MGLSTFFIRLSAIGDLRSALFGMPPKRHIGRDGATNGPLATLPSYAGQFTDIHWWSGATRPMRFNPAAPRKHHGERFPCHTTRLNASIIPVTHIDILT